MTVKRKRNDLFDSDDDDDKFHLSIDKKTKCVQFTGDISPKSVHQLKDHIKDLVNNFRGTQERTISIEIQSDGGDLFSGCGCYDWIMKFKRENSLQIHMFAIGLVASAATMIYMAGDIREMGDNSYLLIHNLSTSNPSTQHFNIIKQNFENDKMLSNNLTNFYKKHCSIPDSVLKDMMNKDIYITSDLCAKYGITTN